MRYEFSSETVHTLTHTSCKTHNYFYTYVNDMIRNLNTPNGQIYMVKISKKYLDMQIYTKISQHSMVEVKRLGLLLQTDTRGGLLGFSTPRPSALGDWSGLVRLEEVGEDL